MSFYGLYTKELGTFVQHGNKILVHFVTARPCYLGIPGGVKLFGKINKNEVNLFGTHYYDEVQWCRVANLFNLLLKGAEEDKNANEILDNAQYETLDYLKPAKTQIKISQFRGEKFIFVLSYRESEAIKFLEAEGFKKKS